MTSPSQRKFAVRRLTVILGVVALMVVTLTGIALANAFAAGNGGFEAGPKGLAATGPVEINGFDVRVVQGELSNGWYVYDEALAEFGFSGKGRWFVISGTAAPLNGQFGLQLPPPNEGSFKAVTDQFGPGTHILYTDFVVPPNGKLTFRTFLRTFAPLFPKNTLDWRTIETLGVPNQQYRVDIMDPGADLMSTSTGVWLNVFKTGRLTDGVMNNWTAMSADLSAFAGQTVRLRFAQVDNIGNMWAGVDNVKVASVP